MKPSPVRSVATFVVLTAVISWGLFLAEAAAVRGLLPFHVPMPVLLIGAFGPALAACIAAGLDAGRQGIGELLGRVGRVRVGWGWYVLVLAGPAAIFLAAAGIGLLLGVPIDFSQMPVLELVEVEVPSPWLLLVPLFIYLMITLLGEEVGWRGYLLPRLLEAQDELVAGIVVGIIWGIWHLPLAWIPSLQAAVVDIPFGWFMVDIVGTSILYTWVFVNTRGSVFIALLLHTANNAAAMYVPVLPPAAVDTRLFFIVVAIKWMLVLFLVAVAGRTGWRIGSPTTSA